MPADKQLSSGEIDALCDSFEQLCKSMQGDGEAFPQIEDYLDSLADDDRETVLRELLIIEHHYRSRTGNLLDDEEYHRRFSEHPYIVDEVLSAGVGHRCETELHTGQDKTRVRTDRAEDDTFDSLLEALPANDAEFGPTLGDFELLDELGRGGMGIVFRARQKSVDRLVALKILRRDKLNDLSEDDAEMMVDRFRTESQSAAQLEHDHIVPVYEVGEADGIYFYSMRYVQGESLAEVIADHPLDNHSAAQAIEPIARALQAAHDKGVLHRDVKPRNIMVDDATGRPLLTDFGLAKLLQLQQDMTHTGDVMGSPPYMSPEQATDAAHVTQSADIYSLGATLYHALTGRPPFQAATMAETLRQVWFEEPPPPRSLNPAIDRDLETICMKCLEKEPIRRFASASEMADELARYLRGEPILSRPIGFVGQLQRWRRRNPAVANLTGAVVLLVLIGFVGSIYYAIQLRKSLNETQESLGIAVSAVNRMTDIATKEDGLKAYGVDDVRREMLNASREYYDRFVERETNDPLLETERGKAYGRLADIEADLGKQDDAIRLYQQSVDVFAGLEKKHPREVNYTYLRAAYLSNLGGLYRDYGQLEQAETALDQAYGLASALHETQPASVEFSALLGQIHNVRGVVYSDFGRTDKAEKARLETVNLWQQIFEVDDQPAHHHQLAVSHNNLADFYRNIGKHEKAIKHFDEAKAIWQTITNAKPLVAEYAAGLALCEYSLGVMHLEAGELSEAESYLMASEGRRRRLAETHRQLPQYRDDLAASLDSMGRLLHARREFDAAADDYRAALTIREDLRNNFSDVPKYEVAYAASQMNLGDLYKDGGRYAEATGYFRVAVDVLSRVVAANPNAIAYGEHLAGAYYNLALTLSLDGDLAEAQEQAELAADIHLKMREVPSERGAQRDSLAECYDLLATIYEQQGQLDQASAAYEKLLALPKGTTPENVRRVAGAGLQLAALHASQGDFVAAKMAISNAIENLDPISNNLIGYRTIALAARAEINDELGEHEAAVSDWEGVLRDNPRPIYQLRRGVSLARAGNHVSALDALTEGKFLDESNTNPTLLMNTACVISRAIEAAEAENSLGDEARRELVARLLEQGTELIERLVSDKDIAIVEQVRQDRDLGRLREDERVRELLVESPEMESAS